MQLYSKKLLLPSFGKHPYTYIENEARHNTCKHIMHDGDFQKKFKMLATDVDNITQEV